MEPVDPLRQLPFTVDRVRNDPVPEITSTVVMIAQETLMRDGLIQPPSSGDQQVLLQEPEKEDPTRVMMERRWSQLEEQHPGYVQRIMAVRRLIESAAKVSYERTAGESFEFEFTKRVVAGVFGGDESRMRGMLGLQEGQPIPSIGARNIIERILTAPGFS